LAIPTASSPGFTSLSLLTTIVVASSSMARYVVPKAPLPRTSAEARSRSSRSNASERALKEDHPVAVPGLANDSLGVRRLPPLLLPAALPDNHAVAPCLVITAVPIAEAQEQHRGDGEPEDAAADGNGEDGGLAEPDPPPRGGGRRGGEARSRRRENNRRRLGRARQVVAGERGVREPEE